MPKVTNSQVYGIAEAIYRSGYPAISKMPVPIEFNEQVGQIRQGIKDKNMQNAHIQRASRLAKMSGGHDQFLTGITVTADWTISNKAWVEAERYRFLNFISSMSTMHQIANMDVRKMCNEYVSEDILEALEDSRYLYDNCSEDDEPLEKSEMLLSLLYNMPAGLEITAGIITNYRCLKNIYSQRRNHRLPDWQVICDWIEDLPLADMLIIQRDTPKGG